MSAFQVDQEFPSQADKARLAAYEKYGLMLEAKYYEAFVNQSPDVKKLYDKIRYVYADYVGLVAKLCGDMLFGEPVQIKSKDNQDWLSDLWSTNNMHNTNFESAMNNSAEGDSCFRIRIENNEIKIEPFSPSMYFPTLNGTKFQQTPKEEKLCWIEQYPTGKNNELEDYLLVEIHDFKNITMEVYQLKDGKIKQQITIQQFNIFSKQDYSELTQVGLGDRTLIFHIPNYRVRYNYFGTSDVASIESLIFSINNRLTKNDDILDKHGDPILALPPGILDEKGQVTKKALGVIEMPEGEEGKPEYIVWNANLEAAFKQIDKIQEMIMLFAEISPDAFGLGQGGIPASGRALKLRLLRTIAKIQRKRNYYDQILKRILDTAQMLSVKYGYTVNGKKITEVEDIELIWSDGIVNDDTETITNETTKLEAGLTSKKRAIMMIENIDEPDADQLLEEIEDEKEADFPFWNNKKLITNAQVGDTNVPNPANINVPTVQPVVAPAQLPNANNAGNK